MYPKRAALLMLLLSVWAGSGALCAAGPPAGVSMDQAVKTVEKRYHSRVIKAQAEKDAGRTVYVLRLLNESGQVRTVRVDASNGVVL
jgi:uncharacterized membrane protein YkoI